LAGSKPFSYPTRSQGAEPGSNRRHFHFNLKGSMQGRNAAGRWHPLAKLTTIADDALIARDTLQDRAASVVSPSLRLGVTGLSRAGKTVFISALVHNLVHGGRLPMFEAMRSGRIARAYLQEQPDDNVPRFQYE